LRVVLFGLVALVALGSLWSSLTAAAPSTSPPTSAKQEAAAATFEAGVCNENRKGVTAVIDFGKARAALSYCAQNFSGTGWGLLAEQVKVDGTLDYPTGFVCRIEDVPSVKDQDCKNTPTYAEGSWAYFVADEASAGWVLSGTGASMRRPECGTSEAWVFTSGKNIEQQKPSLEPVIFSCLKN
jgi:hypothetical protein